MQVEVEGDAPHDDEAGVQVLDLPTHGPAGASGSAGLAGKKRTRKIGIIVR